MDMARFVDKRSICSNIVAICCCLSTRRAAISICVRECWIYFQGFSLGTEPSNNLFLADHTDSSIDFAIIQLEKHVVTGNAL